MADPIPTFSPRIAPSPGTTNKPEFKVLSAQFGDGYTQDAEDGINNVRDVLSLTWEILLPADAKTIVDFLKGRKGAKPFLYTPSNETTAQRWTCKDVTDKRTEGGYRMVTAVFKRSFNKD